MVLFLLFVSYFIDYPDNLKKAVVEQDEKEASLRKILNLGHTLGHALESITNYDKFTHGEAVIYGIFWAFDIAYRTGLIGYSYYRLSVELLEKYGFKNINIAKKFNTGELIQLMKKDKKAGNGKISLIIPCSKKEVKEVRYTAEELADLFK